MPPSATREKTEPKRTTRRTAKPATRLDGRDMETYLKRHPTVLFRYRLNVPGFVVLLVMAAVVGSFGTWVWVASDSLSVIDWITTAVLFLAAFGLVGVVVYWSYYARVHYLAASDQHLLIGRGADVVAIDWGDLDARALGFSDDDGEVRGVLTLHLEAGTFRLRLFGRYMVLANLQGFISTLLTRIKDAPAIN